MNNLYGRRNYLTPNAPNQCKRLRLAICPEAPWSQKKLADWIKLHPIEDCGVRTLRSIQSIEDGTRVASADKLEAYIRQLIKNRRK